MPTNYILDEGSSEEQSLNRFLSKDIAQTLLMKLVIIGTMHIMVAFCDTNEFYKYIQDNTNGELGMLGVFLRITQYLGAILLCFLGLFLGMSITTFFFDNLDIKGEEIVFLIAIGFTFLITGVTVVYSWNYIDYLITINADSQLIIFLYWTLPYSLVPIMGNVIFWIIAFAVLPKI